MYVHVATKLVLSSVTTINLVTKADKLSHHVFEKELHVSFFSRIAAAATAATKLLLRSPLLCDSV